MQDWGGYRRTGSLAHSVLHGFEAHPLEVDFEMLSLCRYLSVVVLALVVVGCGGGGVSGGGGGGGGGTLTPTERSAVVQAVENQYQAMRAGHTLPETRALMLQYVRGQAAFKAAGTNSQGFVWARFKDGPLLIMSDPSTVDPDGKAPRPTSPSPTTREKKWQLPTPKDAHLYNGFGTLFTYFQIFDIGAWLTDAGYEVKGTGYKPPGSTVEALRNVGGDGFFYIAGHGVTITYADGSAGYAIQTATRESPETLQFYEAELKSEDLVIALCTNDWDAANKKGTQESFLCITTKFIQNNGWSFGENSFVVVNACNSAMITDAIKDAGASTLASWTNIAMNDKMFVAVECVLDRLLGLNKMIEQDVKQRPLDYTSVMTELNMFGNTRYALPADEGGGMTELTIQELKGSGEPFGLLAPSIALLSAHPYEDKLYVYGVFGKDPGDGKVTVDGSEISVESWGYDAMSKMDRITCKLPKTGAGSHGDVQVTVRDHKSNKRQLTLIKGKFKLTHDLNDGRRFVVEHDLRFRVDLKSIIMESAKPPVFSPPNPQRVFAEGKSTEDEGNSKANYKFEGTTFLPDGATISWSGEGNLTNNMDGAEDPKGFIASIKFDPEKLQALLTLTGGIFEGGTQIVVDKNGNVSTTKVSVIFGLDEFDGSDPVFKMNAVLPIDKYGNIAKGSKSASKVATYLSAFPPMADTVTVEWDSISAESPPKDDDPRSR